MANLNDLPLTADTTDDVDVNTVPTFGGGFTPPPQPGTYVGRLPSAEVIFNCFQTQEVPDQGQKLLAVFADESAITLEQFNQSYRARISNRVRYVKVNDPDNPGEKKSVGISDMAQLLRVVNSIPEGKTNTAYGHALVAAGGRLFKFTHDLTANCDPKRDIYKDGAVIKGKKGCGARYATESYRGGNGKMVGVIPKDESGKFATRFQCTCGASLSAWGQIKGFRVHEKYPPAVSTAPVESTE
jgi:hypothetical protein